MTDKEFLFFLFAMFILTFALLYYEAWRCGVERRKYMADFEARRLERKFLEVR